MVMTQIVQIASKEGISYAAAVRRHKSVMVKQTVSASVTVSAVQPKHSCRTIETLTEDPTQITAKVQKLKKTIEMQINDLQNVDTQMNEAAGKKRQMSEQPETNKSKRSFVHLSMDEFLAGEEYYCQMPSDEILRSII